MFRTILTISAMLATPAVAQDIASGDPAAGEDVFKKCAACHVVVSDDGETLAGRSGKVGPNLYGVAMRTLGTYPDFNYGRSMVEAGEAGTVWTEENFVGYVQDPSNWLKEVTGDKRARGKMGFQLNSEDEAKDVYAFLVSIGPEIEADQTEEGESSD